jgi:Dolichyl-phosphate-mannose-protein mannosyltransferase
MSDRGERPSVASPHCAATIATGPAQESGRTSDWIRASCPVVLLSLAWLVSAVLINPVGDFPLNDDWAFGLPVEALLTEHALTLTDWQEPALIAQLFWGALFCLPTGFSFTALRLSTLALGLVGIIGLYGLLRHLGADRRIAGFGAAVLAFNPFYINLSYTFMTDIPFLALMIVSLLLLIRGLDFDRNREIIAGLIIAALAMFVRQLGLMVLIGFLIAYPLRRGFDRRWVLLSLAPTVVAVILLLLYEQYLRRIGQLPGLYHSSSGTIRMVLMDIAHLRLGALRPALRASVLLLMYLGQWCLPLTLLIMPEALGTLTPRWRRLALVGIAGFTVGVSLLLTRVGWLMPMTGNSLNDFGMGIQTLPAPSAVPRVPRSIWIVVTALSALGAAQAVPILGVLARRLWQRRLSAASPGVRPWHVVFLLVVGLLDFGPMAFNYKPPFDRYLLTFLPLVLGLLVASGAGRWRAPGPWCIATSALVLATYLGFGVGATHDYLGWNRVRWAAAAELQGRLGLPPAEVDGGFEYNNYHHSRERIRAGWIHRPGEAGVVDGSALRARLASQPLPDHDVLAHMDCPRWLPWGVSRIYLLNKAGGLGAGPPRSTGRRPRGAG